MNDGGPTEPTNLLDLYLDGQLSPAEREAFETRLRDEPELRAQIELHERMESSLKRVFAVPTAAPIPSAKSNVWSIAPRGWWGSLRKSRIAAVAALILLSIASWQAYERFNRGSGGDDPYGPGIAPRSMEVVYQASVLGQLPNWKCDTDREFATYVFKRLGDGVALSALPADVQRMGLAYTNIQSLSPNVVYLLAKRSGTPIVVFMDRLERDKAQQTTDPKLHLFRRVVGRLVLYELTPFDHKMLLDAFHEQSVPRDWLK